MIYVSRRSVLLSLSLLPLALAGCGGGEVTSCAQAPLSPADAAMAHRLYLDGLALFLDGLSLAFE